MHILVASDGCERGVKIYGRKASKINHRGGSEENCVESSGAVKVVASMHQLRWNKKVNWLIELTLWRSKNLAYRLKRPYDKQFWRHVLVPSE